MKIGFLLQAVTALSGAGDGVRAASLLTGQALVKRGHEVTYLNPWLSYEPGQCDVVQCFMGGLGFHGVGDFPRGGPVPLLCFSPAIDSNEPFWRYRLAAALGQVAPRRLFTIPGELRRLALASDLVVCRSTHERERVARGLGVPREKTEIVLLGVNPPQPCDPAAVRRDLNLPEEFVLHVSRYTDARKNVARLIEAVGPLGLPLVIAGTAEPSPALQRLRELCRQFPKVRMLGFQPADTLNSLYAACRVFCLPSIHEGVGLAGLEAAAHGAAIVATKNGGPADYFGPLAEYVDPFDVRQIREAIRRAWDRPASNSLKDHILTQLTWDHTAAALERAYQRSLPRR